MALKDTVKSLKTLLQDVTSDLDKADTGNKAASQRVRTGTIRLEKIAKLFRKESIKSEKGVSPVKKKKAPTPAAKAPQSPQLSAKKVLPVKKIVMKKAKVKPKAVVKKKPTAKILTKSR